MKILDQNRSRKATPSEERIWSPRGRFWGVIWGSKWVQVGTIFGHIFGPKFGGSLGGVQGALQTLTLLVGVPDRPGGGGRTTTS